MHFPTRYVTIYPVNGMQCQGERPGIVGQLVLMCIEKNIALDDLSLEEYNAVSPVFDEDIYEAISLQTCVDKRLTLGAPGPEVMNKVIAIYDKYMEEN